MRIRNVLVGLVAALGVVLVTASPAAAGFEASAGEHGLTAAQAAELQREVDGYLAALGGTQVAPNRVEVDGGFLLVALPGEKYARDLAADVPAAVDCPYLYFCAYRGQQFTGTFYALYECGQATPIPWRTTGSFSNNQSPGTVGRVVYDDGSPWPTTPAPSSWSTFYWGEVNTVTPC